MKHLINLEKCCSSLHQRQTQNYVFSLGYDNYHISFLEQCMLTLLQCVQGCRRQREQGGKTMFLPNTPHTHIF